MAKASRTALTLPVGDLSKAVELAVNRAAGVPRVRPGIIIGRWVDGEVANANQLATSITKQFSPLFKAVKLTPISIPGKGGITVGSIAPDFLRQ